MLCRNQLWLEGVVYSLGPTNRFSCLRSSPSIFLLMTIQNAPDQYSPGAQKPERTAPHAVVRYAWDNRRRRGCFLVTASQHISFDSFKAFGREGSAADFRDTVTPEVLTPAAESSSEDG